MSGIQDTALKQLAEHTRAIADHRKAQAQLIEHALTVGCSLKQVAEASELRYDQLRMRIRRGKVTPSKNGKSRGR